MHVGMMISDADVAGLRAVHYGTDPDGKLRVAIAKPSAHGGYTFEHRVVPDVSFAKFMKLDAMDLDMRAMAEDDPTVVKYRTKTSSTLAPTTTTTTTITPVPGTWPWVYKRDWPVETTPPATPAAPAKPATPTTPAPKTEPEEDYPGDYLDEKMPPLIRATLKPEFLEPEAEDADEDEGEEQEVVTSGSQPMIGRLDSGRFKAVAEKIGGLERAKTMNGVPVESLKPYVMEVMYTEKSRGARLMRNLLPARRVTLRQYVYEKFTDVKERAIVSSPEPYEERTIVGIVDFVGKSKADGKVHLIEWRYDTGTWPEWLSGYHAVKAAAKWHFYTKTMSDADKANVVFTYVWPETKANNTNYLAVDIPSTMMPAKWYDAADYKTVKEVQPTACKPVLCFPMSDDMGWYL